MMPEDRERLYDDQIGPELLRLGKLCQDAGMSFVAAVDWVPGQEYAQTIALQGNTTAAVRWAAWACQSQNNVDTLLFAIMKQARINGHTSVVLAKLGVPIMPDPSKLSTHPDPLREAE